MSSLNPSGSPSHVKEPHDALVSLLSTPNLNLGKPEDETRNSMDRAFRAMERFQHGRSYPSIFRT